ncbi:exopolysaccharide/PEP-CTERM locus tyrosine autokinase [Nitrosomonas cryotolerans]|uniref:non-specific protein-tyrosine kinase n=1 Tax=Nitrosomonas cryotolerans ATCC 49181 TaxID=1131553 RepID=A0A1N6J7S7_9PROT|nr:XrtA-associated tyrosine autokinase [Nitrosomonas cryotolerans]SFP44841.1 exopolysaccharide/PEP-CTERM locus tyrosine autokinase [Nitrosomonas cryotolerans]SIO40293.1 exopolysaccharide/PEP-CTERM locus tyrosine autokinase [Nitrosomonas cryotolerans ATCC 49181]
MSIIEKAAGKIEAEARIDTRRVSHDVNIKSDIKQRPPLDNEVLENEVKQAQLHSSVTKSAAESVQVTIDHDRLHQLGIVTPSQGKTQIAEQFRIIKRPLLTKAVKQNGNPVKNANLIMLTSALAGEGKSFCAVNLAMSIASEMDHRVLLIDADVARPTVPKILGIGAKKGLLDILLNEKLDVADVMLKTNVEKLTIITAGSPHSHATELLASHGMSVLLDELSQRYHDRIVIFDSPPILLTSEARVLTARMGQIVLVVEAEKTTQQAVKEMLRHIGSHDNINLIYNKAKAFSGEEYYGYYYS